MRIFFHAGLLLLACILTLRAAEPGDEVVVVFNSRMKESQAVAAHYAAVRHVPSRQVLGLDLPTGENMTRDEYRSRLQMPLLNFLKQEKLFVFSSAINPPANAASRPPMLEARIRYAVLCFGVPLRILDDPSLSDSDATNVPAWAKGRNGAAVDSELTLLPWTGATLKYDGPLKNPCYGLTNAASIGPTNGALIVTRLDGPTADIALHLVDKAMEAETNGLWGRAYFDARGLTNGAYLLGDEWINSAANTSHHFGFETVIDTNAATFPAGFPLSQIALYAGWYDGKVSGPFTRPHVEFMPGAFAYHLHSFSAQTLRSTNENWCGPLLALGVTATMGCIDEPYLQATPNIAIFFSRWILMGFTFGEAACASQEAISWQTTVVGDPLYRPFAQDPRELHNQLLARHSPMIDWSDLRFVDLNLAAGQPPEKFIPLLDKEATTRHSAILSEKLATIYQTAGKTDLAISLYRQALADHPTPQTTVRLTLALGDLLVANGQEAQALPLYEDFQKHAPDYPDALALWKNMRDLAEKIGKKSEAARYDAAVNKLTPKP
jgi:uncharacterized protein (TIGR03790 family)